MLWHFCAKKKVPFIYASSAATYGDGENGYTDSESKLGQLSPSIHTVIQSIFSIDGFKMRLKLSNKFLLNGVD